VRIFLLTSHPLVPPWNSGDKNLARTLVLNSDSHDLEFIFIGDSADGTPWPVRHQRIPLGFRSDVPTGKEKLRLLAWLAARAPKADLTHALVTFTSPLAQRVLSVTSPMRRPLVITCSSGACLPAPILLRRAAAAVAISHRTAAILTADGVRRVRHIPPGVDLVRFRPAPTAEARAMLGLTDAPTLLFAGHRDPGGGLSASLALAAEVRRRIPDVHLLLALRPRPGEDPAVNADRLRRDTGALGLDGRVTDLGGLANMRAALQASDVVLFPAERLGAKMELPLTVLEAMASGRPAVVAPTPPLDELGDGSLALRTFAVGDPAAADHVVGLLADPSLAAEAGAAARALAEQRYSATVMMDAYAELYAELARDG
jgi:glycosyltransferase involved in cell wall biosynthesis